MASSSVDLNGSGPFYATFHINYATRSGMQSRFDWSLYIGCYSNGWGTWSGNAQVWGTNIGGALYGGTFTLDFRPSGSSARSYLIGSGSTWKTHNSRGNLAAFNSSGGVDTDHGSVGDGNTPNVSITAPRIPVAPLAPSNLGIDQVTADSFRYRFQGNADNGGSTVLEWQIQLATNSAFTTGVQNIASSGTTTITDLDNHTTYWVRSRGRNAVGWSPYSSAISTTTLGHPTAPQSLSATPSGTVPGRVTLSWNAPATTGAGGIKGYNVFRDDVQIATITGTTTSHTDTTATPLETYTYKVAARNEYSNDVGGYGPKSTGVSVMAPGPPTAPRNLTGESSASTPGEVLLAWDAPTTTGAGGITGYNIRFSNGTLIHQTTGTGRTYTVTGLTPGVSYTFKVSARNALADAAGIESAFSNQVVVTPIGEPAAPTGLTVTPSATTPNRLVLNWTAPGGTLSGYSIFQLVGGSYQLIGKPNSSHTSFTVDDLTPGVSYSFHVRARTVYTDTLGNGYPGNWGGPASANASGVPSANSSQSVASLSAVTDSTNDTLNGTYTINAATANTIRYAKTAANIPSALASGTVTDNTNAVFNGTYVITTPTSKTISYSKTNANIPALPSVGGTATNNTNIDLNGSYTVTSVNVGANLLSYTKAGADISSRAVPVNASPGQSGTVTNLSNAVFNGAGRTITAVTENTISYAQTNANVAESNAAGYVINTTNRDVFNGRYTISGVPAYNVVQYEKVESNIAERTWITPNGLVYRTTSPATLDVQFRSGWSG